MEELTLFIEILKYILPAAAVLVGVWLVLNQNKSKEAIKENLAVRGQALNRIVPLRLQAYERAVLFLERITPDNLLTRTELKGKNSNQLWKELQSTVREEYEHNLAQQLYISIEGWLELVKAKENVLTLINQCGRTIPPQNSSLELAKKILHVYKETESSPVESAIIFLKTDLQKSFRMIK